MNTLIPAAELTAHLQKSLESFDFSIDRPVPLVKEIIEDGNDPNFHLARIDIDPKNHFMFCYEQDANALEHQWKLVELYHVLKPDETVATIITNCAHMIEIVMNNGMFYSLRVNIHHVVEKARKARGAACHSA